MELLGTYTLGYENVRIFIDRTKQDGSFTLCPIDNGCAIIEVGLDKERFVHCLNVLMHEVFEFIFVRSLHRYERTEKTTLNHADYYFIFNHQEMTECVMR